jgi:hypothetical protein
MKGRPVGGISFELIGFGLISFGQIGSDLIGLDFFGFDLICLELVGSAFMRRFTSVTGGQRAITVLPRDWFWFRCFANRPACAQASAFILGQSVPRARGALRLIRKLLRGGRANSLAWDPVPRRC